MNYDWKLMSFSNAEIHAKYIGEIATTNISLVKDVNYLFSTINYKKL